ncbi:hypothetical protein HK101_005941 [Irineochytrium annulatum]|nr:hypothetical protein HK101_005941 [Irineochytrium annulatum]
MSYMLHAKSNIAINADNYTGNFDVYIGSLAFDVADLADACKKWTDNKEDAKLASKPDPGWNAINRKYAPIFRLHPSKSYYPVNPVDWFDGASLWSRDNPGSKDNSQQIGRFDRKLHANIMALSPHAGNTESQHNWEFLTPMAGDGSAVYGHMGGAAGKRVGFSTIMHDFCDRTTANVIAFGCGMLGRGIVGNKADARRREPLETRPTPVVENHFADLEHLFTRFNRATKMPSQFHWNTDGTPNAFTLQGNKPIIYVAQGSHELYPIVGEFPTFDINNDLLNKFLSTMANEVLDHTLGCREKFADPLG